MTSSGQIETDEIIAALFDRPELPPLEPGEKVYSAGLRERIKALKGREHKFVIASLHLLNDDIHHAHLIAQDNEGDSTADLLHATLHRREGDYWNSKYWYSHIRSHPTVPSIPDAKAFVDACEAVKGRAGSRSGRDKGDAESNVEGEMKLRERQWGELKGLVEWTRANCLM